MPESSTSLQSFSAPDVPHQLRFTPFISPALDPEFVLEDVIMKHSHTFFYNENELEAPTMVDGGRGGKDDIYKCRFWCGEWAEALDHANSLQR